MRFKCFVLLATFAFLTFPLSADDAPYTPDYLLRSQDYFYVVGIDPENPPSTLPSFGEILLQRSTGGVVVQWDAELNLPVDINARIPLPNGSVDLMDLLNELKFAYGIQNPYMQFFVQTESSPYFPDHFHHLPQKKRIYLVHNCVIENKIYRVEGSEFSATLTHPSSELIRLSGRYRSVECVLPSSRLTSAQLNSLFPNIQSSVRLSLLPANSVSFQNAQRWIYSFATEHFSYRVDAVSGEIFEQSPLEVHAQGLNRIVKNRDENVVCDESVAQGGTGCIGSYNTFYSVLDVSTRPFEGKNFLTSFFNKNIGWGMPANLSLRASYDTSITTVNSPSHYGTFSLSEGGIVRLTRFPQGLANFTTKIESSPNVELPGLGGVIDLVGHEVGHGYIAAFVQEKTGVTRLTFQDIDKNYTIGFAITEALADAYGKLVEGAARLQHAGCAETSVYQGCGAYPGEFCGGGVCKTGEECTSNGCSPCADFCGSSETTRVRASINPLFCHTYHNVGEPHQSGQFVFEGNSHFRNLRSSLPVLDSSDILCPFETNPVDLERQQKYTNGLFLSRLLHAYNSVEDPFHLKEGYLRNSFDLSSAECLLKETLSHLPISPTMRGAERAWMGSVGTCIFSLYSKENGDAFYNHAKWDKVIRFAFRLWLKHQNSIQGKCVSGCQIASPLECLRPVN